MTERFCQKVYVPKTSCNNIVLPLPSREWQSPYTGSITLQVQAGLRCMYAAQGLEQSVAVMRLGLKLAFNPRRCSLHFQLNAANPEHADIAKKLVDTAQKVASAAC